MKKDVVYIDVEDDITAIIAKVKASKAKIVALVPPKRSTVLNSAVNAKLLKRAADDVGKRIVLITNDQSLITIAGGLGIHVAKNLQSKPYLPEAPETPINEDNVIEGDLSDLDPKTAVGDLAGAAVVAGAVTKDKDDKKSDDSKKDEKKSDKKSKKPFKIPNFERFRLKVIAGAFAVIMLIVGWWWAFQIAPQANASIVAQTSQLDTAIDYQVDENIESSDLEKKVLKGTVKEMKKTVTEDFVATGEDNVGTKATGTITVTNYCFNPGSIGAGTIFTSGSGLVFVASETVTIADAIPVAGNCGDSEATKADVLVRAETNGDNYNLAPTGYQVAGFSSSDLAGFGGQMSGGTTVIKKVVSQADFDKAKANLATKDYSKEKEEIIALFGEEFIGMEDTFEFTIGKTSSAPAVGAEAEKAILSAEITFTEVGVFTVDMEALLLEFQEPKIDTSTQSIYDNGLDSATYELTKDLGKGKYDFRMRTVGIVGPNIDIEALALQIEGKRFSEAKAIIDELPGVVSSEIKLSPFWVNKVPGLSKTVINVEVSEQNLQ